LQAQYLLKQGVAGAFIWSLEMDDFRGSCGSGKYPLLSAIASVLGVQSSSGRSSFNDFDTEFYRGRETSRRGGVDSGRRDADVGRAWSVRDGGDRGRGAGPSRRRPVYSDHHHHHDDDDDEYAVTSDADTRRGDDRLQPAGRTVHADSTGPRRQHPPRRQQDFDDVRRRSTTFTDDLSSSESFRRRYDDIEDDSRRQSERRRLDNTLPDELPPSRRRGAAATTSVPLKTIKVNLRLPLIKMF